MISGGWLRYVVVGVAFTLRRVETWAGAMVEGMAYAAVKADAVTDWSTYTGAHVPPLWDRDRRKFNELKR